MAFVCDICGKSLRNVHELCVAEELGDYNFDFSFEEFKLPMTLKIHVILDHYHDYFDWTNKTMRYTNAEITETAHSTFKMSERIHKFKISRNTSLVAKGALAHRLQRRTTCKIQNGHQEALKWQTGKGV